MICKVVHLPVHIHVCIQSKISDIIYRGEGCTVFVIYVVLEVIPEIHLQKPKNISIETVSSCAAFLLSKPLIQIHGNILVVRECLPHFASSPIDLGPQ